MDSWTLKWSYSSEGYETREAVVGLNSQECEVLTPSGENAPGNENFPRYTLAGSDLYRSYNSPHRKLLFETKIQNTESIVEFANQFGLLGLFHRIDFNSLSYGAMNKNIQYLPLYLLTELFEPRKLTTRIFALGENIPIQSLINRINPNRTSHIKGTKDSEDPPKADLIKLCIKIFSLFFRAIPFRLKSRFSPSPDYESIWPAYREPIDLTPHQNQIHSKFTINQPLCLRTAIEKFQNLIDCQTSLYKCEDSTAYRGSVSFQSNPLFPEESEWKPNPSSLLDACFLMAYKDIEMGRLARCVKCGSLLELEGNEFTPDREKIFVNWSSFPFCNDVPETNRRRKFEGEKRNKDGRTCETIFVERHSRMRKEFKQRLHESSEFSGKEIQKLPKNKRGNLAHPYEMTLPRYWNDDRRRKKYLPRILRLAIPFAENKIGDARLVNDEILNFLANQSLD